MRFHKRLAAAPARMRPQDLTQLRSLTMLVMDHNFLRFIPPGAPSDFEATNTSEIRKFTDSQERLSHHQL